MFLAYVHSSCTFSMFYLGTGTVRINILNENRQITFFYRYCQPFELGVGVSSIDVKRKTYVSAILIRILKGTTTQKAYSHFPT